MPNNKFGTKNEIQTHFGQSSSTLSRNGILLGEFGEKTNNNDYYFHNHEPQTYNVAVRKHSTMNSQYKNNNNNNSDNIASAPTNIALGMNKHQARGCCYSDDRVRDKFYDLPGNLTPSKRMEIKSMGDFEGAKRETRSVHGVGGHNLFAWIRSACFLGSWLGLAMPKRVADLRKGAGQLRPRASVASGHFGFSPMRRLEAGAISLMILCLMLGRTAAQSSNQREPKRQDQQQQTMLITTNNNTEQRLDHPGTRFTLNIGPQSQHIKSVGENCSSIGVKLRDGRGSDQGPFMCNETYSSPANHTEANPNLLERQQQQLASISFNLTHLVDFVPSDTTEIRGDNRIRSMQEISATAYKSKPNLDLHKQAQMEYSTNANGQSGDHAIASDISSKKSHSQAEPVKIKTTELELNKLETGATDTSVTQFPAGRPGYATTTTTTTHNSDQQNLDSILDLNPNSNAAADLKLEIGRAHV